MIYYYFIVRQQEQLLTLPEVAYGKVKLWQKQQLTRRDYRAHIKPRYTRARERTYFITKQEEIKKHTQIIYT